MEQQTFFPGASRRVILSTITLQKDRRIKCNNVRMPLTGEAVQSMPDWLSNAYTAVSQNFTEVQPEIQQIADMPITLSNHAPGAMPSTELFESPSTKAPNSELKNLMVLRTGSSEDPEVTLQFTLYTQFSRDLWKWLGEMGGQEIHMAFQSGKPAVEVVDKQTEFVDARPELDPAHDAEFPMEGMPSADYEESVRQVLGVPKNASDGARMVSVRPKKSRELKTVN